MSDIYLNDQFQTEQDAGNDTRTVEGEEQTAQQIATLCYRVLDDTGTITQTPNAIAQLEGDIRAVLTPVPDVGTVNTVSVTNSTDERVTIAVDTTVTTIEQPYSLQRVNA